jgi:fructosamine-3-kinase
MAETFRKAATSVPPHFFAAEAAGLAWLAEATAGGGASVVPVLSTGPDHIELPQLTSIPPSRAHARDFGRRLAITHLAGAPRHGSPPPGLHGNGFIATLPLVHDLRAGTPDPTPDDAQLAAGREPLPWGRFYAQLRVLPFLVAAVDAGQLGSPTVSAIERLCERLDGGDEELTGPAEPPARLHGDLWNGNVMWTPDGAVLIDPAAHGGHRETDLAMLELFGLPHLGDVIAAYHEAAPLAAGREHRIGVHQLHPLLVHVVLFGGGSYARQLTDVAARYR